MKKVNGSRGNVLDLRTMTVDATSDAFMELARSKKLPNFANALKDVQLTANNQFSF